MYVSGSHKVRMRMNLRGASFESGAHVVVDPKVI